MATPGKKRRATIRLERVQRNRMRNLRTLAGVYPTIKAFCERIAQYPAFFYQTAGPNPHKQIGEAVARDIEARLNLKEGWLDQDEA